jgi:chromosome segregation ATPase
VKGIREKFTENAEQFDSLMVEMLSENESLEQKLKEAETRYDTLMLNYSNLEECHAKDILKLEAADKKVESVKVSLKNAYDHIQHECYNDALSSILEAQHNIEGEE